MCRESKKDYKEGEQARRKGGICEDIVEVGMYSSDEIVDDDFRSGVSDILFSGVRKIAIPDLHSLITRGSNGKSSELCVRMLMFCFHILHGTRKLAASPIGSKFAPPCFQD